MKKKFLCLFLGIWLCLSFALPLYALDGTINTDDNAELVRPTLEMTLMPAGAAAIAHNLDTNQTYYYRINGNILSNNDNEVLSEPGWMPEGASVDSVIGPIDDRIIADTTQQPYSAIAFITVLYSLDPLIISYGTATMISPDTALTAAHCLYNVKYGGWPIAVAVYPGTSGSLQTPYGVASATEIAISIPYYEYETITGFYDEYPNYPDDPYNPRNWRASLDWGVIHLDSNIGSDSGYLGFQCGNNAEQTVAMISGYPGDKNGYVEGIIGYSSYNQYKHSNIIFDDTSSSKTCRTNNTSYQDRILSYWIDATQGQSGSPILCNNNGTYQIIGIHSVDIENDHNEGFGLTTEVFHFLTAYK